MATSPVGGNISGREIRKTARLLETASWEAGLAVLIKLICRALLTFRGSGNLFCDFLAGTTERLKTLAQQQMSPYL